MANAKRIFIAGSTGLLGRHLAPILSEYYRVIAHGHSQGAECIADLTKPMECNVALEKICPDVIINLVALTNVDDCEKQHQRAFDLNVGVPENLAKWCQINGKFLVQISTDQVYDGPALCTESQVTIRNNYALTKRAGELPAVMSAGVVLRTNFFGKSLSPHRISFTDWLNDSLIHSSPLNLFNDVYFSPLHISTLCDAILHVVERPMRGVYNLGSHNGMSKEEFAQRFAKVMGYQKINAKSISIKDSNLAAMRPSEMRMNVSRFESTFGMRLPCLMDEISKESKFDVQF